MVVFLLFLHGEKCRLRSVDGWFDQNFEFCCPFLAPLIASCDGVNRALYGVVLFYDKTGAVDKRKLPYITLL